VPREVRHFAAAHVLKGTDAYELRSRLADLESQGTDDPVDEWMRDFRELLGSRLPSRWPGLSCTKA
jgi:hypothetical protein